MRRRSPEARAELAGKRPLGLATEGVHLSTAAALADRPDRAPRSRWLALPDLRLNPAELMLVAAHPGDLKAARRVGLQTAFIHRPLEYGPGSPAREDPDADESARDLEELAARLEPSR